MGYKDDEFEFSWERKSVNWKLEVDKCTLQYE